MASRDRLRVDLLANSGASAFDLLRSVVADAEAVAAREQVETLV